MNVGIVVHRFDAAEGTGRYTVELVTRLARDHAVTVYAARATAALPAGVRWIRVPAVTATAYTAILSFPAAFRLVRRPHDVIHAQGWVTGRADVVTAHIVLAAWRAAARRAGVRSAAGERWLGGAVAARERRLMGRARAVIAPSQRARADLAACYGRTYGVHVVPHGFPAAGAPPDRAAARHALGLPGNATIALFVGDLRKGFDALLADLAAVPELRLAVASHTPVAAVRQRATAAGVGDRVQPLGSLPDISPAYAAADFLVHPTIYDTFGLVVSEAMAHGLPVVVSREAGISELLVHGESAWLIGPDPGMSLARALGHMAADPAFRARLAAGARRVAMQRSWDAVARDTVAVYAEAMR